MSNSPQLAAASLHVTADNLPDLTACDLEPIHIPGSIQPHGHMLILDRRSHVVVGAAGSDSRFKSDVLGRPYRDVLHGALPPLPAAEATGAPQVLGKVAILGQPFEVLAYVSDDYLVLEFLPEDAQEPVDARFLGRMHTLDEMLERSSSLEDLFRNAADAFRQLTGHARVMIYRFIDSDAGSVVGESRAGDAASFMNHHFPASDIPVQARALYVRNRVRVINDVDAPAEAIVGTVDDIQAVDLSDSILRSVSPVHLRYLRNMGVRASASMSIVRDGMLWGLVACHHPDPLNLSMATRLACRSLADSLSRQIRLREETLLYRERIRLRSHEDAIMSLLGADEGLDRFFSNSAEALAELVGATGFAALQGQDLFTFGSCPSAEVIRMIAKHAREATSTRPLVTSQLARDLPEAAAHQDVASGLLSVTMSTEVPTILMWFRAEQLQVVTWAGNPHKNVPVTPGAVLEPRASFEAWTDEVRGRSRPWTTAEVEAAGRLVRLLLEARNSLRIRRLNAELSVVIRENESLIRQKDFLLKEVNHRVQNSLSLVASFLRMQARGAEPATRAQLDEAQGRLSAVSLVHRRLYQDDRAEVVDLSIYLDDLIRDMKASVDPKWAPLIQTGFAPILVPADKAVTLGLLTNELVANAIKYAYEGQAGPISVALTIWRDNLRLEVSDRGIGSDGVIKGTGFGMRMVSALVEQLGGGLETAENLPGMRFVVVAPSR